MSTGESHKFHLFKRPLKRKSTYLREKCNRDATLDQNRTAHHGRLSLLLSASTDKSVFETKGEPFSEKERTAVLGPCAQSNEPGRGNTRLYREETIGILRALSASRQYGERSSSVQKDE